MTRTFGLLAALLLVAFLAQGNSFTINSTGVNTSGGQDQSYSLTADSTGEHSGSLPQGAWVITTPAGGWTGTLAGTQWIGPSANESNGTWSTGCCAGSSTYQTTFTLPVGFTAPSLSLTYLVDDSLEIILNGHVAYTGPGYPGGSDSDYGPPGLSTTISTASWFTSGANTLQFVVSNIGGPTGLDVEVTSATFNPATVPEPATMSLIGTGLAGLAFLRRRKRA